jgi:hypothetical protein
VAWLERSYTIVITVPLKQQRVRSTAITLNGTNTFRHTLKERDARSGDKSGSKVNFTRVTIAKIPSIVGEGYVGNDEMCPGVPGQPLFLVKEMIRRSISWRPQLLN